MFRWKGASLIGCCITKRGISRVGSTSEDPANFSIDSSCGVTIEH